MSNTGHAQAGETRSKPKVIKFEFPGLAPDVRLKVLGEIEFHVHSIILKLYSGFFRKFLDSPEKEGKLPASQKFRYEWVSQVDEDGSWSLVSASSQGQNAELAAPKLCSGTNSRFEGEVFEMLINIFYMKEVEIQTTAEFLRLASLADYYLSLHILSHSLGGIMLHSPSFCPELKHECLTILPIALKMRHRDLFNDCIIHSLGPWSEPKFRYLGDRKLQRIAQRAYNVVATRIADIERSLLEYTTDDAKNIQYEEFNLTVQKLVRDTAVKCRLTTEGQQLYLPARYERLQYTFQVNGYDFGDMFEKLLENETVFTSWMRAGVGYEKESFLCGKLDDEDLPWDPTEKDW